MLLVVPLSLALATPRLGSSTVSVDRTANLQACAPEAFGSSILCVLVLASSLAGFSARVITVASPAYLVDRGMPVQTAAGDATIACSHHRFRSASDAAGRFPKRYILSVNLFRTARLSIVAFISFSDHHLLRDCNSHRHRPDLASTVPPTSSLCADVGTRWLATL